MRNSVFEIVSFPGLSSLPLLDRPDCLFYDDSRPAFERLQFLYFLPLNAIGWVILLEFSRAGWRNLISRLPKVDALLLIGAVLLLLCGLLTSLGSFNLITTVSLLFEIPQAIIHCISFGLVEVTEEGLLAGSIYFIGAFLVLLFFTKRRLGVPSALSRPHCSQEVGDDSRGERDVKSF